MNEWPLYVLFGVMVLGALYWLLNSSRTMKELAAIYAVLAFAGVLLIFMRTWWQFGRTSTSEYVAASDLPANHLLTAADLAKPDRIPGDLELFLPDQDLLCNRYLRAPRRRGESIRTADVVSAPSLEPHPDSVLLTAPIEFKQAPVHLNAGKNVLLTSGDDCIGSSRVAAIFCTKEDGCKSAMIYVPAANAPAVLAAKELKLLPSSEGAVCPPKPQPADKKKEEKE